MDQTIYTKLTVIAPTQDLESVSAIVSMLDPLIMVEDYSDSDSLSGVYGNLVDESILSADKTTARVSVFLPPERSVAEYLSFFKERFASEGIDVSYEVESTAEEDWAENWKQYYHPLHFGSIAVVPAWEEYTPSPGEKVVRMDPGMAFGTGTHETTALAMRYLEKQVRPGMNVLDIGTGSGILAIAASRMGAKHIVATDLDPDAVKNACENIAKNAVSNVDCRISDLLSAVLPEERFDLIFANIVADILLRLLPDVGTHMNSGAAIVLSGIIRDRCADILDSLDRNGFLVKNIAKENDWCAILAEKNPD